MYAKFYLKTKLKKNPTDNDGWTPLHHASWNDKFEVCKVLLEEEFDKILQQMMVGHHCIGLLIKDIKEGHQNYKLSKLEDDPIVHHRTQAARVWFEVGWLAEFFSNLHL